MSAREKTAGKTAERAAANVPRKLDEAHKARIARWRRHAEEQLRLTHDDHKKHPGRVNTIKSAEFIANAEGLPVVEYIVLRLIKTRIANGKDATWFQALHDETDTRHESLSAKARNSHERALVVEMINMASFGLPQPLKEYSSSEKAALIERFYRKGDGNFYKATRRAMHFALGGKEVA